MSNLNLLPHIFSRHFSQISCALCVVCLGFECLIKLLFNPLELDHGLSEPQIRCITHQMLQALECLHSNGCIHRDLKAGNVLLCPDGSIRLGKYREFPSFQPPT